MTLACLNFTCYTFSEDESNQECLSCKENYILENGNCINYETSIPLLLNLNNTNEELNQKINNDLILQYNTS